MQTAGLTDLLLDQIVAETAYLEIALHLGIHCHDSLTYGHVRHSSLGVDSRIEIQLVEEQNFLLQGVLVDSEKQLFAQLVIVHDFVSLLFQLIVAPVFLIFIECRLIEDNQDFAEDERLEQWSEIVQQHFVEIGKVPLLRKTHLSVGII